MDRFRTFEGMGEIRAQDDFAAYVNRKWAENTKINDRESNVSSRTEQTDAINKAKLEPLGGEKKDDNELTSLQNLYKLLLDWDKRNAEQLRYFQGSPSCSRQDSNLRPTHYECAALPAEPRKLTDHIS